MQQTTESTSKVNLPPLEFIRECFRYEPDTGKLFWIERPRTHFKRQCDFDDFMEFRCGKEAGKVFLQTTNGKPSGIKTSMMYGGKVYNILAHIVGWRLSNGDVPEGFEVDHKDRDPLNNKMDNLRLATHAQNMANSSRYRGSKSGLPRGVCKNGNRYAAQIRLNGKLTYLGSFLTVEAASAAYLVKARELHGEFFAG
jgi:hypothetical protein